jgi:hypothetical protein
MITCRERGRATTAPGLCIARGASVGVFLSALCIAGVAALAEEPAENPLAKPLVQNPFLASGDFIHIPGPNPILTAGPRGAWDGDILEASDALVDGGRFYLYYHGAGGTHHDSPYQVGLATAAGPLGPFRRHGDAPVLPVGPKGSWDDRGVACAMLLKETSKRYLMFYSGTSTGKRDWTVGLATAPSLSGPWKKFAGNPLLKNFGYVGGVVKVSGTYFLYTEHPIDSTAPDYGPISLATAQNPDGPWTPYANNPVLKQGPPGTWDAGGFSEAKVQYFGGMFHIFYGGCTPLAPRILSQESIGYAYSIDGFRFTKYDRNPVAPREANPNAAAFAEVHSIVQPPFIFLYHTLRYLKPWRPRDKEQFPTVEDLGVQVLAFRRPFSLDVPVLGRPAVAAGTTTSAIDCPPVCLRNIRQAALALEGAYSPKAVKGIRIHVRASRDGLTYDRADVQQFAPDFQAGQTTRNTLKLDNLVPYIRVLIENLDPAESTGAVSVVAKLQG